MPIIILKACRFENMSMTANWATTKITVIVLTTINNILLSLFIIEPETKDQNNQTKTLANIRIAIIRYPRSIFDFAWGRWGLSKIVRFGSMASGCKLVPQFLQKLLSLSLALPQLEQFMVVGYNLINIQPNNL